MTVCSGLSADQLHSWYRDLRHISACGAQRVVVVGVMATFKYSHKVKVSMIDINASIQHQSYQSIYYFYRVVTGTPETCIRDQELEPESRRGKLGARASHGAGERVIRNNADREVNHTAQTNEDCQKSHWCTDYVSIFSLMFGKFLRMLKTLPSTSR